MICPACGSEEFQPDCLMCGYIRAQALKEHPPLIAESLRILNVPSCHDLAWGDIYQSVMLCSKCGKGWPVGVRVEELLRPCPAAITRGTA